MPRTTSPAYSKRADSPAGAGRAIGITLRVLVGVLTWIALTGIVFMGGHRQRVGPSDRGEVSKVSIHADRDFRWIDVERTEALRKERMLGVKDVFLKDYRAHAGILAACEEFLERLKNVPEGKAVPLEAPDGRKVEISALSANGLREQGNKKALLQSVSDIISRILESGILSKDDREALMKKKTYSIIIRDKVKGKSVEIFPAEVLTMEKAGDKVIEEADSLMEGSRQLKKAVAELVSATLVANLVRDVEETNRLLIEAREKVNPVYLDVRKGDLVIAAGKAATREQIEQLNQLNRAKIAETQGIRLSGVAMLILALMLAGSLYMLLYERAIIESMSHFLLVCCVTICVVIIARFFCNLTPRSYELTIPFVNSVIVLDADYSYLVPVAFAGMAISTLLNARIAVVLSIILAIISGFMAGEKFHVTCILFLGSLTGVYSVRRVRRRIEVLRAGALVGLCNAFVAVAFMLCEMAAYERTAGAAFWSFINGVLSSILVLGTLPFFEHFFHVITDISLLELSDMNHPLLKKLMMEAPGTYHHSLVVGNLAETACEAIGADSLLARVGAYYHDVGKVEKSEYFVENQTGPESTHENLTPSMSRLIIVNHVKNGVEIARKHKLNEVLVDFIGQHHGTSLVHFFYQRAVDSADEENGEVSEESFRYLGPKPQTKEIAVMLLADSVEAASRTLADPSPSRIKGFVRKVINSKFMDAQLDECELTLKDLHGISESFSRVLTGVYHSRVSYPAEDQDESLTPLKEQDGPEEEREDA